MSLFGAAAVVAAVGFVVSYTGGKKTEDPSSAWATVKPYRVRAIEALKAAVNTDPKSDEDLEAEAKGAIVTLQTSVDETEIRSLRNMIAKLSVERITNGMPTTGKNYDDAARAVNDLANVIEAVKFAGAKDVKLDLVVAGRAARSGRPHTPLASRVRRGSQLHTSRGIR